MLPDRLVEEMKKCAASSPCIMQCYLGFQSGKLTYLGPPPGQLSANDAFQTFQIRFRSALNAGIVLCGFEETLPALERHGEAAVLLFHFIEPTRLFTIFFDEAGSRIVGCVGIRRRNGDKPVQ